MRKTIHILNLLLLASLFLAACNLPSNGFAFAVGPTAWIDSPINGAQLPLAPVVLIGHGYDNASVSQFEWSVNGSVVNTLPPSAANGKLFNNQASWTPTENGKYTLSMRAMGASGGWSGPVSVVITIGDFRDKVVTPVLLPPVDITTPQPPTPGGSPCHRSPEPQLPPRA